MPKPNSFWTPARLGELNRLWKRMPMRQLERHFGKKPDDLIQAYNYQRMSRLLFIKQVKKKGVTITYYRSATAELATSYDNLLTL